MSMQAIRDYYKVPAKRGGRVFLTLSGKYGTIVSARGHYLRIRCDGESKSSVYHPQWQVSYLMPVRIT